MQLPVPLPLFGQYGAVVQQSAFDEHPLPPQNPPPSTGGAPSVAPHPVVHPPVQVAPLSAQVPSDWHCCGCEPTHCKAPGLHTPVQPLFTHASLGHSCCAPHCPFVPHVSKSLSLTHMVAPGVHVPVQAPLTHAMFVQATGLPHCPDELQVCTPLPEHCVAPGLHWPPQALPMHT